MLKIVCLNIEHTIHVVDICLLLSFQILWWFSQGQTKIKKICRGIVLAKGGRVENEFDFLMLSFLCELPTNFYIFCINNITCFYFPVTTALMCYDCNSEYDRRCGDPFDPYSIGEVNCSKQEPREHLKDKVPVLCRKTVQKGK